MEFEIGGVKYLAGAVSHEAPEGVSLQVTMIPLLFEGAFIKNCKGIKRKQIDAIYDGIGDKTGLMGALMEMYAETLSTLTEDNSEGNVTWEITQ